MYLVTSPNDLKLFCQYDILLHNQHQKINQITFYQNILKIVISRYWFTSIERTECKNFKVEVEVFSNALVSSKNTCLYLHPLFT